MTLFHALRSTVMGQFDVHSPAFDNLFAGMGNRVHDNTYGAVDDLVDTWVRSHFRER